MTLEPLDYLNGVFNLIFISISISLGVIIISKYFKNKNVNFILTGLTLVLLVSGWYGTTASFITALLTGGEGLSFQVIIALNFIPLPFSLMSWMTAFTNFLYKEKQKLILISCGLFIAFFYVIFLYYLIIDPAFIGEKISPVDTRSNSPIFGIFLIILLLFLLISGINFALKTMQFEDKETNLKGKLLLIAFPSFCFGAFLDALIPSTALTLVIFRLILISSAIEFYGGFILPNWMRKILM